MANYQNANMVTPAFDAEHHAPQSTCPACPFGGPKVGSKGNPKGSIVFVAESPGKEEVKAGMPLVGQAGKIFHTFVPDVNSPEGAEIYILNAMECYPRPNPRIKNEKSMNYATTCCRERLLAKVAEHPRKLIIA